MKASTVHHHRSRLLSALCTALILSGISARAGEIANAAQNVRPLLIGAEIPDLAVQTFDGQDFNLKAAVAEKPAVLIFYRGGWCPFCNLQLGQLQAAESELRKLGYQILAISPDRPAKLADSEGKDKLAYTLLSDSSMAVAKAFGIAFRVDDTTLDKYKDYGIDLEDASGQNHHLLPVPAVFLVGTDGRIRFVYVNPDYKIRLSPEVLLAAAKSALDSRHTADGIAK